LDAKGRKEAAMTAKKLIMLVLLLLAGAWIYRKL
jgi:flagellar biogenesis protein FliO